MRPTDQQTALVTGATDGMGKALATELAARGASVLVHGRNEARLEAAVHEIRHAVGTRGFGRTGPTFPAWMRCASSSAKSSGTPSDSIY